MKVAKQELAEMQSIATKEGMTSKLESWDWWYYAEKLRKQKYDLDESEMAPYLKLENVRGRNVCCSLINCMELRCTKERIFGISSTGGDL